MGSEFPRPKNFQYDAVFYNNESVALIWGCYKNGKNMSLGMRWTDAESPLGLGYPNIFGHGMWMVVPDNIAFFILQGIQGNENEKTHISNTQIFENALSDLKNRFQGNVQIL